MKKILVPTDFSDNAWNAIFTALKLHTDIACTFYFLHAYEPNTLNMLSSKGQRRLGVIYDSLAAYSEQELNNILAYLEKNHQHPKHIFEAISISDPVDKAVEQLIAQKDIDLVCMGTQGATGAKQVFMGSKTVKVLNKIKDCPILVVPSEHDFKALKSLAFPTDFSKKYEKHQMQPLRDLVALWNTHIHIVHVAIEFEMNDQQLNNQKILKERLNGFDVMFYNIDFESNIAHTLEKFISNTAVDMIALIKYQHSFWEKVIGEPVVKKMTFHTKVPLLVLPE